MQHQAAADYPQNALGSRAKKDRKSKPVPDHWEIYAPWQRSVANPEAHKNKTCRVKIVEFFHDRRVHLFFIVLLVIDVLFVFAELMLEAARECHIEEAGPGHECTVSHTDTHSTTPHAPTATHSKHLRKFDMQSGGGDHGAESDKYCLVTKFKQELPHNLHWLHTALFVGSISILVIFLIELLLLLFALGTEFFKHWLYVLDLFIVTVSLGLDLALKSSAPGIMIFLRIWRFSRIFHGLSTAVQERAEMMEFQNLPLMTKEMLETPQSRQEALKESIEALRLMAAARAQIFDHFGAGYCAELDLEDTMNKTRFSPTAVKIDPYNQFGEVSGPSSNVLTPSPAASQPMPPIPPLNLQGVTNGTFNSPY